MAISEFEIFKIEKAAQQLCQKKNNKMPTDQLHIDYRLDNQILYIFEVRPRWDKPSEKLELMVAKLRYVKSSGLWKLFWLRQTMKWQLYSSSRDLMVLLNQVEVDQNGCFWG